MRGQHDTPAGTRETQSSKELVDVSLQILGEADLQLQTTKSVDIHYDVQVGNSGTAAANTTTENT